MHFYADSALLLSFSGVPGMPGMNMYSRDELEKMRDSMKVEEDAQPKSQPAYSENISFFQTVMDSLNRLWQWLKSLFIPHTTNEL